MLFRSIYTLSLHDALPIYIFTPANIVVAVGTTVTWTWSPNVTTHNVVFSDGAKSPDQSAGTFTRTFSAAGTFNYSCTLHSGMNGTVKVQ